MNCAVRTKFLGVLVPIISPTAIRPHNARGIVGFRKRIERCQDVVLYVSCGPIFFEDGIVISCGYMPILCKLAKQYPVLQAFLDQLLTEVTFQFSEIAKWETKRLVLVSIEQATALDHNRKKFPTDQ